MDVNFKVTGNPCKTGFVVLANNGKGTRYFQIGEILKKGRKWMVADSVFKSKKIAAASIKGDYLIALATSGAAEDDLEEHRQEQAAKPVGGQDWPKDAAFHRGDVLKHKLGYVGPCVSAGRCHKGTLRYFIDVPNAKVEIGGTYKDFVLCEAGE